MFPFGTLAKSWWKPGGALDALHALDALRIRIIDRHFAHEGGLAEKTVLDIGCGGGIASESLARLGARVTGIDPDLHLVRAARVHAAQSGLSIRYRHGNAEDVDGLFDLVLLLDVVEHVANPGALVEQAAKRVAPGGRLVVTSVAQSLSGWMFGIISAEYLLGWIPRGTHDWKNFRSPGTILPLMEGCGLACSPPVGLAYHPASGTWEEDARKLSGNWIAIATRPRQGDHEHPRRTA